MSILNQQLPANDNFTNYDDLDTLISNMKLDREDVNEGKPKPIEDAYTKPLHLEDEATLTIASIDAPIIPKVTVITEKKAQFEAHFLARNNDRLQSIFCSLIADDDPENYGAEEDEIDEIAALIYEWRKDSEEPLPLWLEIASAVALIYGPKYNQAFKFRKAKKQLKIAEQKNDELLNDLLKMKADIEQAKIDNDLLIKEKLDKEILLKEKSENDLLIKENLENENIVKEKIYQDLLLNIQFENDKLLKEKILSSEKKESTEVINEVSTPN